jgi:hypothetical protein
MDSIMARWSRLALLHSPFGLLATGLGAAILIAAAASAELPPIDPGTRTAIEPSRLDGAPTSPLRAPSTTAHVGSHGNVLIVDEHGLLVVERSAGKLVRADREGKPIATLSLTPGLGEIVHDGAGVVFVADRAAGRVIRVAPGDAAGKGLAETAAVELGEPHGLALTPDGATLLVTDVSEHELVALGRRGRRLHQWHGAERRRGHGRRHLSVVARRERESNELPEAPRRPCCSLHIRVQSHWCCTASTSAGRLTARVHPRQSPTSPMCQFATATTTIRKRDPVSCFASSIPS